MPELTDQQFDADAARQLKFNTMITANQQQNAKERMLRRAAHQPILDPIVVEAPATVQSRVLVLRERTVRVINFLVMDSRAYERVHHPWRIYNYDALRRRYMTIRMPT